MDFTFIEQFICYFNSSEHSINHIIDHESARGVHDHALKYQNTDKNIHDYWEETLSKESKKGEHHLNEILKCVDYIKSNLTDFSQAFKELEAYIPNNLKLKCKLYFVLGYDIGIVSNGNAFLNLGNALFHEKKRELLYFAMHELHHVAYTHYNPIYSLEELKTTQDLIRVIKYSTHLEGLAVYASIEKRQREEGFTHKDYFVLNDYQERLKICTEYFGILNQLEDQAIRPLISEDFEILERMSSGKRLWYVTGAHMAQKIDQKVGREALNMTIHYGSEAFFNAYFSTL